MRQTLFAGLFAFSVYCLPVVGFSQEGNWGSLEGKVTLKGPVPKTVSLVEKMTLHADKACCLAGKPGEKVDQTWVIDAKTKGVANVFVYLRADAGKDFPIHEKDKKRVTDAIIDQPNCAFIPHVIGHFPAYKGADGKMAPTGEKMIIKNSATVAHNARAVGDPLRNPGFNVNLPPGKQLAVDLKAQRLPVMLECNIHPWMNGRIMVFDHPYFAVTKADGTFSIPRVPVGANITIMAWHEGVGWVATSKGRQIELKAGKNTENFEIEAK